MGRFESMVAMMTSAFGLALMFRSYKQMSAPGEEKAVASSAHAASASSSPSRRRDSDSALPPAPPPSPSGSSGEMDDEEDDKDRLLPGETYEDYFIRHRDSAIEAANEALPVEDRGYLGDGSESTRRMYLHKQAYRKSRERMVAANK